MTVTEDRLHTRTLRDRLILIFKVILWAVIAYLFATETPIFQRYPRIGQIAYGVNTFLTASIVISIGRFMLITLYRRHHQKNNRVRGNYVLGINQIATLLNVVFIILGLMLVFGINPKEFLTSITIVAMAIALLFKDYITNMISGLLIMFSDQYTIGDYVKIGEHQGRIMDITLANIVVKNEEDDVVLIPNNTAFTTNIINQSLHFSRKLTIGFELPLHIASNRTALEKQLDDALKPYQESIVPDSRQLRVVGVGSQSVQYKLQFTTVRKDTDLRKMLRNTVYEAVIVFAGRGHTGQATPSGS